MRTVKDMRRVLASITPAPAPALALGQAAAQAPAPALTAQVSS
jgi:hypothetical protein